MTKSSLAPSGGFRVVRGKIVATLIRPNKLLYRMLRPSARWVRRYVHPQSWLGGKLFSPFGVKISKATYSGIPGVSFSPKRLSEDKNASSFFPRRWLLFWLIINNTQTWSCLDGKKYRNNMSFYRLSLSSGTSIPSSIRRCNNRLARHC